VNIFSSKKAKPEAIEAPVKAGLWGRLGRALKLGLTYDLNDLFRRHETIDDELLEEIETLLLTSDVGVEATEQIIGGLTNRLARNQLADVEAVRNALRQDMTAMLEPVAVPLELANSNEGPFVILMVGVNGSGKTTTIGKLAHRFKSQGKTVMLAAGDTFRAAAVEQLQEWGVRNEVPVIAQPGGADSASVIFDALQSARARRVDVLIADTAGRLHTHSGLMDELKKIRRVIAKQMPGAPHETMLVIDAGTGQNALNQAEQFKEAVAVSGITISKLDGTAKGGAVFAVAKKLGLPIRYIGVGEGADDLRDFSAEAFVDSVLAG
jgi:fused signal recognition particle receptor